MLSQDKNINKKGFLMIATLFLITFILGSFFTGYRIIYSKGEKVISAAAKNKTEERVQNISVLTYNELYKIDRGINEGVYMSSLDFFCGSSENFRVWLNQNKSDELSRGGYIINKIILNRKIVYEAGTGNCYKIMKELLKNGDAQNIFEIKLEKRIRSRIADILFTTSVTLEYNFKNIDITKPNAEYIKEFTAYADK